MASSLAKSLLDMVTLLHHFVIKSCKIVFSLTTILCPCLQKATAHVVIHVLHLMVEKVEVGVG